MGPPPKRRPVPRHLVGPRDPDAVDIALLALMMVPTGLLALTQLRKVTHRRRRHRNDAHDLSSPGAMLGEKHHRRIAGGRATGRADA